VHLLVQLQEIEGVDPIVLHYRYGFLGQRDSSIDRLLAFNTGLAGERVALLPVAVSRLTLNKQSGFSFQKALSSKFVTEYEVTPT